ncbi:MAG: hypothetical protein WCD70_12630 [Alphaproteobacteria bacterium]
MRDLDLGNVQPYHAMRANQGIIVRRRSANAVLRRLILTNDWHKKSDGDFGMRFLGPKLFYVAACSETNLR